MSSEDKRSWDILEKVALSSLQEQKRARRWGIFFKVLTFAYLFIFVFALLPGKGSGVPDQFASITEDHVGIIRINGVIADDQPASADNIIKGLRSAFENKHSKAVMLVINSPGGSPVQSGYVYNEMDRLQSKYPEKKLYAVIKDLGASGAYYIAASADEIYADQASLVGSIGVISSGFGFEEAIDKLGIEHRVFTAGNNKNFLDPFEPLKEEQVKFWEGVLTVTHQQFIEKVKQGRGDRLTSEEKVFSGLIWSGEQALGMGIVDGLGSPGQVARDVINLEKVVDYTPMASPLEKLTRALGVSVGEGIAKSLQQQTLASPQLR